MISILKKKYKEGMTKQDNKEFKLKQMRRVFYTFNSLLEEFYKEKIYEKKTVLDIGEGDRSFVEVLKENNINAKGYDIENLDLEKDSIPEKDESVDLVVCNSVIEHLKDISNIFSEIKRILKKNGSFIIVTPNFYYDYKNFYDDPTHVNPFTTSKLKNALDLFEFKNIHLLPWIVKKNPKIWRLPFKFFFARYILIARNDTKLPLPNFLKGQTKVMVSIAKKN